MMLEQIEKEVYRANIKLPKYGLVTITHEAMSSGIDRKRVVCH